MYVPSKSQIPFIAGPQVPLQRNMLIASSSSFKRLFFFGIGLIWGLRKISQHPDTRKWPFRCHELFHSFKSGQVVAELVLVGEGMLPTSINSRAKFIVQRTPMNYGDKKRRVWESDLEILSWEPQDLPIWSISGFASYAGDKFANILLSLDANTFHTSREAVRHRGQLRGYDRVC